MFDAFSIKYQKSFSAKDVTDLNDKFKCLNSKCNAEFYLRGVNSLKATHFAKKSGSLHINGCAYDIKSNSYEDTSNLRKFELEDIYNKQKTKSGKISSTPNTNRTSNMEKNSVKNINSPKDLLKYCLSNNLDTTYLDSTTINDIIIDERNLCNNANFEGVSGLRLVLGNTVKYNLYDNTLTIRVATSTKNNKEVFLTAIIKVSSSQLKEIINYILNTYSKFGNHQVAVFAKWNIAKKYHIECTINEPANLIYKFATNQHI